MKFFLLMSIRKFLISFLFLIGSIFNPVFSSNALALGGVVVPASRLALTRV